MDARQDRVHQSHLVFDPAAADPGFPRRQPIINCRIINEIAGADPLFPVEWNAKPRGRGLRQIYRAL